MVVVVVVVVVVGYGCMECRYRALTTDNHWGKPTANSQELNFGLGTTPALPVRG